MADVYKDGLTALNLALCHALGLSTENLAGVTLQIEPCQLPSVIAIYNVMDAHEFTQVTKRFTLNPTEG